MRPILLFLTIVILSLAIFSQQPQQTEHPGIELYLAGKYPDAIQVLNAAVKQPEWKSNARIWNFLGLAYIAERNFKSARKAAQTATMLEPGNSIYRTNLSYVRLMTRDLDEARSDAAKAIELDPKNASAHYIRGSASMWQDDLDDAKGDAEAMISIDGSDPRGYVLKSEVIIAKLGRVMLGKPAGEIGSSLDLLKEAKDALAMGIDRSADAPNRKMLDEESAMVNAFYRYFAKGADKPATPPNQTVTPLKILSKPKASYTDKALNSNVQGSVRVAVLLGSDGRVQYVMFLKRLGAGLDEEVLRAARQIRFEPKKINGQPVSTVITFEYSFNIG
jgi:TonB family protein